MKGMSMKWLLGVVAPVLLLAASTPDRPPEPVAFVPTGIASYAYEADVLPEPTIVATTPTPSPVAATPPTKAPSKTPKTEYTRTPKTYVLRPVVAMYSQATIDQCKLVLWSVQPYVIAGHNHCGFHWLDDVPMGSYVKVEGTHDDATYLVVGHNEQSNFTEPGYFKNYDLVLQTCTKTGLGFTLATRIG